MSDSAFSALSVRVATEADIDSVVELTNDAFMADAFFKKKEYHLRFTKSDVETMIGSHNSVFLVAHNPSSGHSISESITGSLFLHWDVDASASKVHFQQFTAQYCFT